MSRVAAAVTMLFGLARGLMYTPLDHGDLMWDTWIYRRPSGGWVLYYLVHDHAKTWNAVNLALSADGVHFADAGTAVYKDCLAPDDCALSVGSGAVWPRLRNHTAADGEDEEYVMNFSQQDYICEAECQTIFFATSVDLLAWVPVAPDAKKRGGLTFQIDETLYHHPGRWDTISVLPRPGGGYYGYWTATPKPAAGGPADCGPGKSCGAGFGQSFDGLHWTALPTPGPKLDGELGGVAQLGGRTFMTFGRGHLFEALTAAGPFTAVRTNHAFLTDEGGSWYARLWGGVVTGDANLVLVSHQQSVNMNPGTLAWHAPVYAGLLKRATLGADGVLRAMWWEANDALRGPPLTVRPSNTTLERSAAGTGTSSSQHLVTECVADCVRSGLWLQGSIQPRLHPSAGAQVEASLVEASHVEASHVEASQLEASQVKSSHVKSAGARGERVRRATT